MLLTQVYVKCKINGAAEPTKENCFTVVLINVVSAFFQKWKVCIRHYSRIQPTLVLPLHWQKKNSVFLCFFKWRFFDLNEPRTCVRRLSELNQLTIIDRLIWSHARFFLCMWKVFKFWNWQMMHCLRSNCVF